MDETTIARLEQLVEETHELAEENNNLLHDLRRSYRRAFWGKVLLWVLVFVLPFLVLGQFLHALLPSLEGQGGTKSLLGVPVPSAEQLEGILNSYRQASSTE